MTADLVPFDLVAADLRLMIIDLGESVASQPAGISDLAVIAADELRRGRWPACAVSPQATSVAGDDLLAGRWPMPPRRGGARRRHAAGGSSDAWFPSTS